MWHVLMLCHDLEGAKMVGLSIFLIASALGPTVTTAHTQSTAERWVPIATEERGTRHFLDTSNIRRPESRVIYLHKQIDGSYGQFLETVTEVEMDCEYTSFRPLNMTVSLNGPQCVPISINIPLSDTQAIPDDSVLGLFYDHLC